MKLTSEKIIFMIGIIIVVVLVLGNVINAAINTGNSDNDISQERQQAKIKYVEKIEKDPIEFETKIIEDNTINYGETITKTEGVYGEKTYTYKITYKDDVIVSRKVIKEEITKHPISKVIIKGTKVVWKCVDATSYDRNSNNDNLCTSNTGEKRYVGDCAAVKLDPNYIPGQSGAYRYNGCAR